MALRERLSDEMKDAMRARDDLRLSTIRLIRSAVKNRDIDLKRELNEQEIVPILNDAVHRLHNFPSTERVNRVLQVIQLVFNEIHK